MPELQEVWIIMPDSRPGLPPGAGGTTLAFDLAAGHVSDLPALMRWSAATHMSFWLAPIEYTCIITHTHLGSI